MVKRPRRKAHYLSSTSGEVKNEWRYNSALHIRLLGVYRNKLFILQKRNGCSRSTVKNVKLSQHVMKAYRGSGGTLPVILNPKLDAGEWSASHPGGFTPEERALRCP